VRCHGVCFNLHDCLDVQRIARVFQVTAREDFERGTKGGFQ